MRKVKLSIEDQRRIDEDIQALAATLGEIYGDASEVEVLIGLAVSASLEHGIERKTFFDSVEQVYEHVDDFRMRLEAFEAEEDDDETTAPGALLS